MDRTNTVQSLTKPKLICALCVHLWLINVVAGTGGKSMSSSTTTPTGYIRCGLFARIRRPLQHSTPLSLSLHPRKHSQPLTPLPFLSMPWCLRPNVHFRASHNHQRSRNHTLLRCCKPYTQAARGISTASRGVSRSSRRRGEGRTRAGRFTIYPPFPRIFTPTYAHAKTLPTHPPLHPHGYNQIPCNYLHRTRPTFWRHNPTNDSTQLRSHAQIPRQDKTLPLFFSAQFHYQSPVFDPKITKPRPVRHQVTPCRQVVQK